MSLLSIYERLYKLAPTIKYFEQKKNKNNFAKRKNSKWRLNSMLYYVKNKKNGYRRHLGLNRHFDLSAWHNCFCICICICLFANGLKSN
jgi:hypothetical protein